MHHESQVFVTLMYMHSLDTVRVRRTPSRPLLTNCLILSFSHIPQRRLRAGTGQTSDQWRRGAAAATGFGHEPGGCRAGTHTHTKPTKTRAACMLSMHSLDLGLQTVFKNCTEAEMVIAPKHFQICRLDSISNLCSLRLSPCGCLGGAHTSRR